MNPWRILSVVGALLLASAAWIAAGRQGATPAFEVVDARMASDEVAWRALDLRELAGWRGPYWVRLDLDLAEPVADAVLALSMRAASEVSWDGVLLGTNGRVGRSAQEELPGRIDWTVPLPRDATAKGAHHVSIRASSFHSGFAPLFAELEVQLAPIDRLYARRYDRWLVAAIAFGAIAVAGLYFFVAYRRRAGAPGSGAHLLILLGAIGLLLPLVESWRPLLGYGYDLHPVRLYLLLALNVAAAILLPAYLSARMGRAWSFAARAAFAVLLAAIVVGVPGFDGRSLLVQIVALTTSLAIVWTARGGARDDALPLAGLLATTLALLALSPADFLDGLYFVALAVLMVFLLLRHATHLAALGEQNAQLEAQRARLTTQLLERSIHPHWLMNTLTSLQELIEQSPAHASRMVELLAEEFSRMARIGERALIPLDEEIALCRAHLEILELAHGRRVDFAVDGATDAIELPPGTLHTLVENGLTHAGAAACAASAFRLRVRREGARVHLDLRSALGTRADGIDGTGTRFIRASLEAAFPNAWAFSHGSDGSHWRSWIELECAS